MRIEVMVKAGVKGKIGVEEMSDGSLVVRVGARAHDGEANRAVVRGIAEFYGVAKGRVKIVRGEKSRQKVVEISE